MTLTGATVNCGKSTVQLPVSKCSRCANTTHLPYLHICHIAKSAVCHTFQMGPAATSSHLRSLHIFNVAVSSFGLVANKGDAEWLKELLKQLSVPIEKKKCSRDMRLYFWGC